MLCQSWSESKLFAKIISRRHFKQAKLNSSWKYVACIGQIFFISLFTNPPTVIFWKVEFFYFILSVDSKYYLFCWKNFFWGSVCVLLRVTLLSDCSVQIFRKMMKYLKIGLPYQFYYFSGDIKNKKLWKWPVNWSFSELFFFVPSPPPPPPPDPKSWKKILVNQLIKKNSSHMYCSVNFLIAGFLK